jgi:hypothetical protein
VPLVDAKWDEEALSVPAIAMEGEPRRGDGLDRSDGVPLDARNLDRATHWIKSKTLTGTVPVCLCRW